MKFETFKSKSTGVIAMYPAHYATHPVFGADLEIYVPSEEVEEDKVIIENHEIPAEQRVVRKVKEKTEENGDN